MGQSTINILGSREIIIKNYLVHFSFLEEMVVGGVGSYSRLVAC